VSLMYGTFILDPLSVLHNRSIGSINSIIVVLYLTTVTEKTKFLVDKSRLVADDTDIDDTFSRWNQNLRSNSRTWVIRARDVWKTNRRNRPSILSCFRKRSYSQTKKIIFLDFTYNVHRILTYCYYNNIKTW